MSFISRKYLLKKNGSPSQVCTGVDIVEVVHLVGAVAQGAHRAVVAQCGQIAVVAQRGIALAVPVETVHLLGSSQSSGYLFVF